MPDMVIGRPNFTKSKTLSSLSPGFRILAHTERYGIVGGSHNQKVGERRKKMHTTRPSFQTLTCAKVAMGSTMGPSAATVAPSLMKVGHGAG